MAYEARFQIEGFNEVSPVSQETMMRHMVEALVSVNMAYLLNHRVPRLYASGVRYEMPKSGQAQGTSYQAWRDIPSILRTGQGTCHELSAWRIAELRFLDGINNAGPWVTSMQLPEGRMFHTAVLDPSTGESEDPSKLLGMGNDEWRPFYRS